MSTAENRSEQSRFDRVLELFEQHKFGIIGTLTVHTLLLFMFLMMDLRSIPTQEEKSDLEMDVLTFEDAEQLIQQMDASDALAQQRITNLTSNITATKTFQSYTSQRLADRVEEDLKRFEQEEFDRLSEERRERGEEVVIPELDPSKWNKELYMDKAAEPVKVEGATTVWHDLESRVRENDVPGYLCPKSGRVAVRVTVSADGTVQKADLDQGRTANADDCMIEHALRSTKRARFSSGQAVQSGTVFFLFLPQ